MNLAGAKAELLRTMQAGYELFYDKHLKHFAMYLDPHQKATSRVKVWRRNVVFPLLGDGLIEEVIREVISPVKLYRITTSGIDRLESYDKRRKMAREKGWRVRRDYLLESSVAGSGADVGGDGGKVVGRARGG